MAKPVRWNDGLGVTVAEARGRRNAHKGLLDLEIGSSSLDGPEKTPEPCNEPVSMHPKNTRALFVVPLTKSRAALRSCTA